MSATTLTGLAWVSSVRTRTFTALANIGFLAILSYITSTLVDISLARLCIPRIFCTRRGLYLIFGNVGCSVKSGVKSVQNHAIAYVVIKIHYSKNCIYTNRQRALTTCTNTEDLPVPSNRQTQTNTNKQNRYKKSNSNIHCVYHQNDILYVFRHYLHS